jgi:choline monooxygenase
MTDRPLTDLSKTLQPIAAARGLPNEHYVDQAVFEEERDAVLFANWSGIGVAADVPNEGDVYPVELAGMPLLMVRDAENKVRVFQNTCRHRGMMLVQEPANVRGTIRCPYHSWCYGLNGALRSTPHVGGPGKNLDDSIDRATLGLIEIRSYVYRGVVFANVSGTAPEFEEYASKLMTRWGEHDKPMYHGGSTSAFPFDVACNWKLAVENYCESYHLPWIHPGLNSYSRLEDHYHIEEQGDFSGQGTMVYRQIEGEGGKKFPDFEGLSSFWDEGAEYIALYPNVLLAAQRDHAFAVILLPQGPNRTIERNEIFYSFDPAEYPEYAALIDENATQWKGVLAEDIFVIEGMQKGRGGVFFDGGKFAPVMDSPTFVFHDWIANNVNNARMKKAAE